jgi:hypothetical protein
MDGKRIAIGVILLAIFGIFLVNTDRLPVVIDTLSSVLPEQEPIVQEPVDEAPVITSPLIDAGLIDGVSSLLKPNEVVLLLDSLETTTASPASEYERDNFGSGWLDLDGNGCDQRNDTLLRDLTKVTFRAGTNDCVVITGILDDPFTGETINFVKEDASKVQIDHMVPLSWAWRNGASTWSDTKLRAFANDPANLTAVSGSANGSKSDKGPADWRPSNTDYRCVYVTRFIYIVDTWDLTIDDGDRRAARRELAGC